MRRARTLLVILVGLVTLVLPATAGASVDRHTNSDWKGTTEQGGVLKMLVVRTEPGGPWVIPILAVTISFVCDNGNEGTTDVGFGGFDFPIVDGYAAFHVGSITWAGHFAHDQARGTVRHQNNHCDSGVLTWTADHLHPQGG